jgi:endonuclease/exonuclease/phosphatase family metal-dependent hydrolase
MEGLVSKIINAGGLMLVVAVGGWFLLKNFDIQGLNQIRLSPKAGQASSEGGTTDGQRGDTVRIATFNIQVFGESKADNARVMDVLAQVARRFDVVAIQEVRAKGQDILPRFVELINAQGRRYDYVIGPRLGRTTSKEQYAFVFDTQTIDIDPSSLYTVDDPDDRLHREPLVAGFRARAVEASHAFTFTLVNVHTDPDEVEEELNALDDVFRAVRSDGRDEDDVILLGDLNADDTQLGELARIPYLAVAVSGTPTNTRATEQYDNLLFDSRATAEFTGRSGVLDLMKQFRLTQEEALTVSDHCPVWAEFSVYEGGQPGRLAAREEVRAGR